ncbi:LacI family DNA-binding transcriptional regulator [Amycolatopsis taiwanensis]|uniref:LacI family transcriptional regulator n=1 Tax=Amycolatopsis taiwanensis TaxID=342230 RepID=A0A9W6R906_9PSEU|nr:LacI family DNA-binding transcriptional regulator [Amycolatopsis taiwanensis]GLY71561.1 LacI family transcriptional regulator [Amycolatopsis taiwanensis]
MAANLRDVARRAGVSVPTASRVLSGADYRVSDDLRARVERAARELDYVPNAQAQALLQGNAGTVGVLAGDVRDPYFSEIINGVHAAATVRKLLVTICNTDRDVARELEYFRLLQAHRTGIVIIAGSELDDETYKRGMAARSRSFQNSGGRVIAVGNPFLEADHVLVDNVAGGRALGEHLVALGHREIGVVAGDAKVLSTVDRIAGLREALEGAGGMVHVRYGSASREGGYAGAQELLKDHPGSTAIVGSADQMAIGALTFLRHAGRTVPGDISIAGFNDIAGCEDVVPALTSVRLPLTEMGAIALELATTPAPPDKPLVRELSTELIVRESTGRARR